ncbi:MAG TPA: EAL domain-containing protein [Oscillospiraceae bacterium]|nr:EAL domain-containing protein [Oscillospiraceae bacterium]
MFKKMRSKHSEFYDIDGFLSVNQRFNLTLITCFYLISRFFAVVSLLTSYKTLDEKTFLIRLALYSTGIIMLLFALIVIKKRKAQVLRIFIILNMVIGIIVMQFVAPTDNQFVNILTLLIQLFFVLATSYLSFHSTNVNIFNFILSAAILLLGYYFYNKRTFVSSDFSTSFILSILFALFSFSFFTQIVTIEHKKIIRFIKGLTYVDYSISLPNEKKLIEDYFHLLPNTTVAFIGIYIVNLSSLNRQCGYKNVQIELLRRIDEIKDVLKDCSELYKLSEPIFVFAFGGDDDTLCTYLKKIESILSRTIRYDETIISFKMNVIGTKAPSDGKTAEELLANLQIIKYSLTKDENDSEGTLWYNPNLLKLSERTLALEKDIHTAIKTKKINIAIQPKVAIAGSGKGVAGEVLARWTHEIHGEISPLEFIPLVEREGLMDEFTSLIIYHTDNIIKEYKKKKGIILNLSINISATSLVSGNLNKILLVDRANKLNELGGLELELTESVLFDLNDNCKQYITDLKDAGYRIAIDDFGTGFSNFEYLQEFEIDTLKIDKRIIDKLTESEKSNIVADALIKIAHTLGAKVVAEGVELKSQAKQLKALNCDYIQGYYYSKPLPPKEFLEFVTKSFENQS